MAIQGNRVNKFDASKSVTPAKAGAYTPLFFLKIGLFQKIGLISSQTVQELKPMGPGLRRADEELRLTR